ncbi:hypothetical protein MITS9509_02760 [Synechococcus sp. MIT S9509]|nr:hypothetical protein MITS9504_02114 [Synechococcus sp. MIT S9504]KZR90471.1 hypothetical protein MITS9509_02760 [Synechococcus sp. MIT S9509]
MMRLYLIQVVPGTSFICPLRIDLWIAGLVVSKATFSHSSLEEKTTSLDFLITRSLRTV